MKKCSVCKTIKSFEDFGKDKHNKNGYRSSCRECNRLYRISIKEERKIYQAKQYLNNKEEYKIKHKEWRTKNPEKVKEGAKRNIKNRARYNKKMRLTRKAKVFELYGNKCANIECGDTRQEVLTIDHINNDGYIQRKIHKVGNQFYSWIIKNKPIDLQLLCYNCNMTKAHTGKYPSKRTE